jgi:4-hydroxy-tetrahydrodipicolinate synthase
VTRQLSGIWSAALTPLTESLRPDASRAIDYYGELLENGCDGIAVLGTTGEAMSFSTGVRVAFMQALAQSLPLDRLMVGTGAASLDDAIVLTSATFQIGFAAALVMPPFFFRDANDEGIMRFFDALFAESKQDGTGQVLLYNFPRMSGITFHPPLIERLSSAYPDVISGLKDSSNDRALQAAAIQAHPRLAVFPGSEDYLVEAKAYGAAGCISGSVCLWPRLAQDAFRQGDAELAAQLAEKRRSLDGQPLIRAVRARVAHMRNDSAWERAMPPL